MRRILAPLFLILASTLFAYNNFMPQDMTTAICITILGALLATTVYWIIGAKDRQMEESQDMRDKDTIFLLPKNKKPPE